MEISKEQKSVLVTDEDCEISQCTTLNANSSENSRFCSKLSKDVVFEADRNLSEILISQSECNSSHETQNKSSSIQHMSTKNYSGEVSTSRPSLSNNLKLGDNIALISHPQLGKRTTCQTKKDMSCLPTKDNVKESVRKRSKLSPSLKKARNLSGKRDFEFNAQTLAIRMGFEKPHEKIIVKSPALDKKEEITKQISPVEIIQQIIDYRKSCKCSCLSDLNIQDIASHRIEVTLLDRHSRDFFIMGLLRCGAVTVKETSRHNRIRNRFNYRLLNTRICHCCFLAMNNIGGKYLKNLKKHFAEHGVTSRLHGNLGRKPYHAMSSSDITDVVEFVNRYTSSYGVPVAKHLKNSKARHTIRLPSSDNVTSVHKKYKEFNEQSGKRVIALTSFRKIWSRNYPHIKLTVKDPVPPVKNLSNKIDSHELISNVDDNTDHSALKQMQKTERDSQGTDIVTPLSDIQTVTSQKCPVNFPCEHNSGEMTRSQMSVNMYLSDRDNHDALQYGYIFSQSYMPMAHHLQTFTNNTSSSFAHINSKTTVSKTSPHSVQHPSFPVSMNSSVQNITATDTLNSSATDKHLPVLSPNRALNATSSQVQMSEYGHKTEIPVFIPPSSTTNAGSDIHQQISSHIGSSLTNLSQQIHMSLLQ